MNELPLYGLLGCCKPFLVGQGVIEPAAPGIRLSLPSAAAKVYSDAQIDDYSFLPRHRFPWQPPAQLTIRARFSPGRIAGTAGFGFWNNPFTPLGGIPALPRAAWFFYASPPSNMALAEGVPGHGWKAACIDATQWTALAWAPAAPIVLALNQFPSLRTWLWPRAQRALCINEALLKVNMEDWHNYRLSWQFGGVTFQVDGAIVLQTNRAPRGPMGFVAWVDNQYAIVTPRGQLGWGWVDVEKPQWMEISELEVDNQSQSPTSCGGE